MLILIFALIGGCVGCRIVLRCQKKKKKRDVTKLLLTIV